MNCSISIGKQDFADMRENGYFLVDKTGFIRDWWDSGADVTLITRPRRFGKTLNMSMLNCFFSNKYADRDDLFEGLEVWKDERYRQIQGKYPVIFLSFADVKQNNYSDAVAKLKNIIQDAYLQYEQLYETAGMTEGQKQQFRAVNSGMSDVTAQDSLKNLTAHLAKYYGKKVIILLDEYDTPMQEAYVHGYWDEFTAFIRSLFNSTFKTNPYLERAVMTGITRISKESMFSDLNNLNVITTTSEEYSTCFGFTEEEVFDSLEMFGLSDKKEDVKRWYDGFTFGSHKDIYNPWSVTSYLAKKKLAPYWASTSSNGLVSRLLQTASSDVKKQLEELQKGGVIVVNFDEQIIFNQLDANESAIWSLMLAGGYLKIEKVDYRGEFLEPWYHLSITNLETKSMFANMFKGWFGVSAPNYNRFMTALVSGDIEAMNYYMNKVAFSTFSYFDTADSRVGTEPERFYHGFVLGLMVEQAENYEIRSNRESGFGRYDIMMIPKRACVPPIVIEFKVRNSNRKTSLEDTAREALRQIEEKNYDAELIAKGFAKNSIRHYGFAFEGKRVFIGEPRNG